MSDLSDFDFRGSKSVAKFESKSARAWGCLVGPMGPSLVGPMGLVMGR